MSHASPLLVNKRILAVDFGKSGGFAWNEGVHLKTKEMPDSIKGIVDLLRDIEPDVVMGENVHSMPGQGSVSTATFMRGVGVIEGVCWAYEYDIELINPLKWVAFTTLKRTKHFVDEKGKKSKLLWKKYLLQIARDEFPASMISLKTADAVLMWNYRASQHLSLPGVENL